jgi:hypothetical protein
MKRFNYISDILSGNYVVPETAFTGDNAIAEQTNGQVQAQMRKQLWAPEEELQFTGTTGRSAKNNNPLNLERRVGSYQDKYGAELEPTGGGKDKKPRFAKFPTMMDGYLAGLEQIRIDQNKPGMTLEKFVNKFAPAFENPTEQLISQYASAVGARRDALLKDIPAEKLIVPMLARESSTKIIGRGPGQGLLERIGNFIGPSSAYAAEGGGKGFDYTSGLLSGEYKPPQQQTEGGTDYTSGLIQGGPAVPADIAATGQKPPEMRSGSKLVDLLKKEVLSAEGGAPMTTITQAALVDDPATKFQIFGKNRFPGMSPEEIKKRYFMKGGDIYYLDEEGRPRKEIGSGTLDQVKKYSGDIISMTPEMAGEILGFGLTGGPMGAAGGAMAAGQIKKLITEYAYGEPVSAEQRVAKGAMDVAGPLVGYGVAKGVIGATERLRQPILRPELARLISQRGENINPAAIQELKQLAERFDIGLTAPEITKSPTLINLWNQISQESIPAADKVAKFIREKRIPEIDKAIQRELGKISPETEIARAGEAGVQASQNIKQGIIDQRAAASGPIYEEAYKTGAKVDVSQTLNEIKSMKSRVKKETDAFKALDDTERLLTKEVEVNGKKVRVPEDNLEILQSSKEEIDRLLTSISGTNQPKTERRLANIKNNLLDKMDEASEKYRVARETHAEYSKPLDEFMYGPKGKFEKTKPTTLIGRLTELKGDAVYNAPNIVFDQNKTSPEAIKQAKNWFVKNGYETEWNAMARGRIQNLLNEVQQTQTEGNLGYSFRRKLFPTEKARLMWEAALSPDQFANMNDFLKLLDATAQIIYTNSKTPAMQNARREMEKEAGGRIAKILRATSTVLSPAKGAEYLERAKYPNYADALVTAMINPTPQTMNAIQRIKKIEYGPRKAIETLGMIEGIMLQEQLPNPFKPQDFIPGDNLFSPAPRG